MRLLSSLRELGLPSRCAACNAWGRAPLCAACEGCVRWIADDACARCGAPSETSVARCRGCRDRQLSFDRARAAAVYEGPSREALKAFKLLGERRTAAALARWMVPAALSLGSMVCVTWVPSTRRSEAERGFNPAGELARPLARALALPAGPLLSKIRETRDQAGLSRAERRTNLAGAFRSNARRVPPRVLLVDDVMTTGATADACAAALKAGGAKRVTVVTFARAP